MSELTLSELSAIFVFVIACFAIFAVVYTAQELNMCNVSFEGDIVGSFDLNTELSNKAFEKFSVSEIGGKINITLPCKMLEGEINGN